jgi:acetyl coenzyme A synthetase (ADP forming)-like protein
MFSERETAMPSSFARSIRSGRHLVTRDGLTVFVRPITKGDREALSRLYAKLSPESAYARFLGFPSRESGWLDRFLDVDNQVQCTLVAESGDEIVATASYFRDTARQGDAEVAFTVADSWQGRGLGTLLLEQLARHAQESGLDHLYGWTRLDNQQMLAVFRDTGFPLSSSFQNGLVRASLDLLSTDVYTERHAQRAALAAHESIRPFFEPRSVAVIGASRSPTKIGGQILRNLRRTGFRGALYAVNPCAEEIEGVKGFSSVTAVPGVVDLAIICVPAAAVPEVVDECLSKGIKALVVITAGFGETGETGQRAQDALLDRVRQAGARLIGPNCMGLINTRADARLNATFGPHFPPPGRVSMSTQSGALGLAVLAHAERLGLGISTFVSVGNKADVSGNDLIQYWAEDPATDVILMYTEGFGNPRKFAEIVRRIAPRKPIVVLKAGRTQAGLRAAQSHTGALATDDAVVDALLHQCGVIRVRTLEELFDTGIALVQAPLPLGRRVAILTNAGGAGILAADACETEGLQVATLGDVTIDALRQFLPAAASTTNPVDMIASASPSDYERAIPALLADPAVDSLLVIYVPPALSNPLAVAEAIARAARPAGTSKPVFVSFVSPGAHPVTLHGLATYAFPERAATALARTTAYAEWRRTAAISPRAKSPVDYRPIRQTLRNAIASGKGWLDGSEVDQVLRAIGLPLCRTVSCATDDEVLRAAAEIGFPVAVKAVGPTLIHKSDARGVLLGLADAGAVVKGCSELRGRLGDRLAGFLVQEMAPEGPEFLIGCVADPVFGPVVAFGAGGTLAELMRDVVFRLPPLSNYDVASMVEVIHAVRLLRGYRGEPIRDEQALKDLLLRTALLVDGCPEIAELDLNPVRVYAAGARVLDARIRVAEPPTRASRKIDY